MNTLGVISHALFMFLSLIVLLSHHIRLSNQKKGLLILMEANKLLIETLYPESAAEVRRQKNDQ